IVNAIASHFGLKQEKLQRWYEKIDTTNFGYKEQDYEIIKDFMDKVGKNVSFKCSLSFNLSQLKNH
ncbi:hypothetical protein L7D53_07880, partial [Helicobacter pylori]|nr:hypothetical protein [Helicobacter pylori]